MKNQAGFTLIELIMVIVILGILSAFALPRFADLSGNAEAAALQGAYASAKSTSAIVHASALANAQTAAAGEITMEGEFFALVNGYPDAGGLGAMDGGAAGDGFGIGSAANLGDYALVYAAGSPFDSTGAASTNAKLAALSVLVTSEPINLTNPCFIFTQAETGEAPTFSAIGALDGTTAALTCS
ncbi:type II secretion system protein [Reinekea sp.]|jgi:MSHA pilin protein MshA|uniref:type II secretion system protein n=1 Tax=Reinekea sp. TaxID=1970455 RepID=UPI002A8313C1|nr:type II secretion system protein [Reinekea sp.]